MFKLSISSDLDQACTPTREWGVERIELRTIWDQSILVLSTHLGNGSHAEIRRHADIELDVFSPESFTILRWGEGRHEVVTTVVAGQIRHPLSAQEALRS